jgi:NAD(P)-dependent dehydrogenase (short-subunit alcohol dehydrogenase family)
MLAIVTGGSRGLGRLCAGELAVHGADLLLVARDQTALADVASEIKAKYPAREVTTLCCDLGDPDASRRVCETADRLGGTEILVNNAAVQGPIGLAWEVPWREFEEALRLDFLVPVALCRAFIPRMKARGRGWIINISGGGATGPRPMFTAYAAAKTALVRFSETLAIETARDGIRVNAVAPGAFASGITKVVQAAAESAGAAEAATAQKLLDSDDTENAAKAARLIAYLTLGEGRDVTGKLISAVWDRWDCLHRHSEVAAHKDVFALRRILPEERNLSLDE